MATDDELRKRILAILKIADLNVTTERIIRKQLEEEFGCSLADRKDFLRQEVGNFLRNRKKVEEEEEEEGGVEEVVEAEAAEEEEEVEEEEQEPAPSRKRKSKQSKEEKPEKKKRGGGGLNKVCSLSPKLSKLLGVSEMPRTQVVKEMWGYIREHGLQDPSNKRKINCDATMQDLFSTKSTDMFQMNKLLSKHIFPKPGENGEMPKEKKPKGEGGGGQGSGFKAEQPLSKQLQVFLATGEGSLPRHEVVRRMWMYIKEHSLQDPSDKRRILCDDGLQKLFGVETFNGFGITKLLAPHIGVKRKEDEEQSSVKADEMEGGGEVEEEEDGDAE